MSQLLVAFKARLAPTLDAASVKTITADQWKKMWDDASADMRSLVTCDVNMKKVEQIIASVVAGGEAVTPGARLNLVASLRAVVVEHVAAERMPDVAAVGAALLAVGLKIPEDADVKTGKALLIAVQDIEADIRREAKKRPSQGNAAQGKPVQEARTGKENGTGDQKKVRAAAKPPKDDAPPPEKAPEKPKSVAGTLDAFFKPKKINDRDMKKVVALHAVRKYVLRAFVTSVDTASVPTPAALVLGVRGVLAEAALEEPILQEAMAELEAATGPPPAAEGDAKPVVVVDDFDPTDEHSELPPAVQKFMHALLVVLNTAEGFKTPAPPPPKTEKQAVIARQAKEKRKQREEEVETARKEKRRVLDEKSDARAKARELAKGPREDTAVPDALPLPAVQYSAEDFGLDPKMFLTAVTVWTLLHSAPQAMRLSRMSLTQFLHALQDERETVIMEHACKGLLEINGCELMTASGMSTRAAQMGKNWMSDVIEFLAEDVGMSTKTTASGKKVAVAVKESSSDDSSSNSSDSSTSSSDDEDEMCSACNKIINPTNVTAECAACKKCFHLRCVGLYKGPGPKWRCHECGPEEEAEEKEEAKPVKEKTPELLAVREPTPQLAVNDEVSAVIAVVTEGQKLGSYCSWPNFKISQRLVILSALANRALENSLQLGTFFAELNETIQRSAKEAAKEDDLGKRFDMEHKAWQLTERLDNGGGILRPLGWDRYRRLYWRFPMDRRIFVQTTPESIAVPIIAVPKKAVSMLIDAEESEVAAPVASQEWGTIAWAHVPDLLAALTTRGVRESALRKALESLVRHVDKEYPTDLAPEDTQRMTRSRVLGGGYVNRLR